MKFLLPLIALVIPSLTFAAAKVTSLNVEGDTIIFATNEAKTAQSPTCVTLEKADKWSVSLTSASGRTLYSLLATSLASGLNVSVVSAQDCADVPNVERALSITVEPVTAMRTPDSGSQVSLYKGDGTTRIGPILTYQNSSIFYLDSIQPRKVQHYKLRVRDFSQFYYNSEDCSGTPYSTYRNAIYYDLSKKSYYQTSNSYTSINANSQSSSTTGVCSKIPRTTYNLHSIDFSYVDPLCGEHACLIL
ncbi:hypothetical protein [Pseudoalteromonas aurantia]|uniref:Uncharacterized protein n=1 Tax=Pseudoalteromonas aurantia 208 TaxID=1314867 RepID=A0ABR9EHC4_9GAMM|nr:hypothetical protein [Pseudoalteromonas aurantia]MBE0370366.1 hypothetical protein [Pseudoalteromonas aurantia 208]